MTPGPAHILIIDDTPTNIEILLSILEEEYDLSFATSGHRALELLARGQKPDIILLDVMMPEMDGYMVCAALKADAATRDIPVIFVTAKTDAESETRALSSGGVDFIPKPVNRAVVRARVRLHLELERRARALEHSLTEIARANDQLLVLSQAIAQSPASILITDIDARISYVNPCFTQETGYAPAEVIGRNPRILKSGLTDPAVYRDLWDHLLRGEPWTGELINRRKTGEVYWEEAHIAPVKETGGAIHHYLAVNLNVTERKQAHERLAFMAHHDVLTSLPNRALFFEHVEQALGMAKRNRAKLALLFIDLDKFKPINDNWGHAVGDQVLQVVAARLSGHVRASDSVGRIGGDEFLVLLTEVASAQGAAKVAEGLRQTISQPMVVANRSLEIAASIGIALFPEHGQDSIALARHADQAMYLAKQGEMPT